MFICALCLYTILCKANFVDGYTQIIPQTPVIKRGSSITLSCILDNNTLLNTNVSQVFWKLNNSLISREHYTIVNESVCRVTIHNVTDANVRVICGINPQNQVLHHIYLQTGFPPEPPQNITCVYYNNANFTCTWNSGKDTHLPTNFTLIRRGPFGESVCKTIKHSCSFYFNLNLTYKYEVQVTAENALGKAATDVVSMDSKKLVKMEPPEIDFEESLPSHEPSLTITWTRPLLAPDVLPVKCTLRYREKKSKHWLYQHNLQMQKNDKMVYNITGLLPFTEYATSLQCIGGDGQFIWSEWSAEKSARTAEQAPSYKVDLWRVLSSTNGHRTVHLKWKETNNFSFGVTLGYKVKWFPEHNEALQRIETTTENEITFNVSGKAYVILVKAYNSAGLSPEARLRIPAITEKTQKIIDYTQILKKNETMTLKWNTTGSRAHRFVVDWCIDSENEPCNISWEYVENVTEWTAQQAPAHGPNLKTERLRKTEVTLNWEAIPKEERNGFIMNYTIIYKPINGINGRQSDVTVDSDTYEYTLRSLMPNTQYTAYIIARNQAGNARGNPINFSTLKYGK
ncbi:interleukin-31 receptor subunit alpha [Discoglossus pictus]